MQEINAYLDSKLVQRAGNWKDLKDSLVLALPPDIIQHVVYAVVDGTTLTVFADSPAWTSRMRFYDADIKKIFTQRGVVLRAVQARTIPAVEARK